MIVFISPLKIRKTQKKLIHWTQQRNQGNPLFIHHPVDKLDYLFFLMLLIWAEFTPIIPHVFFNFSVQIFNFWKFFWRDFISLYSLRFIITKFWSNHTRFWGPSKVDFKIYLYFWGFSQHENFNFTNLWINFKKLIHCKGIWWQFRILWFEEWERSWF